MIRVLQRRNLGCKRAIATAVLAVAKEGALSAIDDMVAFVADPDAH